MMRNKRSVMVLVAAVLLLTGTASADLMVYEYVPGEKVTLDTVTGKYWYWNLQDFVNMTFGQQISAIGGISPTYGWIAGGWHLASLSEMGALWTYSETNIKAAFGSATDSGWEVNSVGRIEYYHPLDQHVVAGHWDGYWYPLGTLWAPDSLAWESIGAWVTTDATVVPVPPSVVMATTGFLTLLGAKLRGRWRRR